MSDALRATIYEFFLSYVFQTGLTRNCVNSRGHIGICFSESLVCSPLATLHVRKTSTKKHLLETKKSFLGFCFSILTLSCY